MNLQFIYCQAQPQAPAKAQTGAEISFNIGLSSHPPTPTRESIIQPQRSKIELHFQNKSYVSM